MHDTHAHTHIYVQYHAAILNKNLFYVSLTPLISTCRRSCDRDDTYNKGDTTFWGYNRGHPNPQPPFLLSPCSNFHALACKHHVEIHQLDVPVSCPRLQHNFLFVLTEFMVLPTRFSTNSLQLLKLQ